MKVFFVLSALITMFSSSNVQNVDILKEDVKVEVFNNGYIVDISSENVDKFDELFTEVLKTSRTMPALGVSLQNEVMKSLHNGVWVCYTFKEPCCVDDMCFDQLLIKFTKDMYGIDVIRGNRGVFEGRNYYIDIHQSLDNVYEYLLSIPLTDKKVEVDTGAQITSFDSSDIKIKEVFAQNFLPSINKDKKDNNTVIKQDSDSEKSKDYEHMIQYNKS